jgi:hypothetical protein
MWQSEEEVTFCETTKIWREFLLCTKFLYISKLNLILRNRGSDIRQYKIKTFDILEVLTILSLDL